MYPPVKFVVATKDLHLQENTIYVYDIDIEVTQNGAQYSLHHVAHSSAKFKVATSNALDGDAFTRKYII